MPLPKHTVQPVKVSQVHVPNGVANELEFVANATLCNLMRQMASISQLATNMFEELTTELSSLAERTMRLQNRLVTLQEDVQNMQKGDEDLTANVQPVQLPQFTSKKPADSQVLSRNTIPPSMRACYERASPAPPLQQMDKLRDDGKISMKIYSDPSFFFDLWSHEMLQDHKHRRAAKKKRVKPKAKSHAGKSSHGQNQQKPQMVIQQTGVGGHYMPPDANESVENPDVSSTTQNYNPAVASKALVPPPIPVANGNYTNGPLPPPPPPPSIPPSPGMGLTTGHQSGPMMSNGLGTGYPAYPHPVPPVHPVNGFHDSVDNELPPPDHPNPPSPPSVPPFMGTDTMLVPKPGSPSDGNSEVTPALGDGIFPPPSPPTLRDQQNRLNRASAGSPAANSVGSHDLPPPPAPLFEGLSTPDSPGKPNINPVVNGDIGFGKPPSPPPPPPPPPPQLSEGVNTPSLPPPPPPPPPPLSQLSTVNKLTSQMNNLTTKPTNEENAKRIPIAQGPPQDLLSAIRAGFQLRKVGERPVPGTQFTRNNSLASLGNRPHDVQAIYEAVRRRRECMENNSSDDDDEDKDGNSNSSGWDD